MPLLHQLRLLRADMRTNLAAREYIRANALAWLEDKANSRERLLLLKLIDRLDDRYPIGVHARVRPEHLSARIKAAHDDQPIKGLGEPWKTRMERFGPIYSKHFKGQIERKMNVRRLRQLVTTWTAYQDFMERIKIDQARDRDQRRIDRAKALNALASLPGRLRRASVAEDLMI